MISATCEWMWEMRQAYKTVTRNFESKGGLDVDGMISWKWISWKLGTEWIHLAPDRSYCGLLWTAQITSEFH